MEFRHLRYFIAVAEECSFSRAAEKLHVSQPPLSRQIRDLEAELGAKLLERNRQGVRLTRLGTVVLASARTLIRDADKFKAEAKVLEQETQEECCQKGNGEASCEKTDCQEIEREKA